MMGYEQSVNIKRRPWQRRIEVFSPKIRRRLTLPSRDAHDAWLLLEANPNVKRFCERPAFLEGAAGRLLDFWVDEGRHEKFWIMSAGDADAKSLPKTVHGLAIRIISRADIVAMSMRIQNWAQIISYRVTFGGLVDRRLRSDILARLEKPLRLERIEATFHPIDVDVVRASLFELLAAGDVVSPDIDVTALGLSTVFKRSAA
jgi:hypothetical protein